MDNSKCVLFSFHMLFTLLMAVTHPADLPCFHPRTGRAVTALLHQDNKSHVLICQVDEFVKGFFGAGLDTGNGTFPCCRSHLTLVVFLLTEEPREVPLVPAASSCLALWWPFLY